MKRVLTALLLIPAVYLVVFFTPVMVVRGVLALGALLCLREFFLLSRFRGFEPFAVLGYGAGALLVVAPRLPEPAFLIVVCIVLLVLGLNPSRRIEAVFGSAAATLLGVVYVCGPFALAGMLYAASPHWLFLVLLLAWVGDSAAFFVGRAIGRHKLAPSISPGKTWEGAIASALFAAAAGVAYLLYFEPAPVGVATAIGFSLSVNAAGQLGDLAESALKRSARMKDSGTLLPGHGGMLDRMDNFLFAAPTAYLWLLWLVG
jgi:phosphatidate cytidylyltransferase